MRRLRSQFAEQKQQRLELIKRMHRARLDAGVEANEELDLPRIAAKGGKVDEP